MSKNVKVEARGKRKTVKYKSKCGEKKVPS